jgi:hypothetical protein
MILASHGIIGSSIVQSTLLLDLYPNAAAAYSLRLLRTDYTGDAIEVRRTNNDVADIGFTSTGELDTAALLAFTGTGALDNGFVTTWYDQSGNGYNATQTTAVNQPQIVSSGAVLTYNSKPTIKFDGVNDFISTPFFAYSNALSLYYVTQRIGNGTASDGYCPDISIGRNSTVDRGAFHYVKNTVLKGASYPFFNGTFGNYDGFGDYVNGDKYLINFDMTNSSGWGVTRNNVLEKDVVSSGTINADTGGFIFAHQINGNRYANNNFCEAILWLTNQSSNRSAINTNINDFYSIY